LKYSCELNVALRRRTWSSVWWFCLCGELF